MQSRPVMNMKKKKSSIAPRRQLVLSRITSSYVMKSKKTAFEKEKQDNFKVVSLYAIISGYLQFKGSYKQISSI